jgi:hypothetical protein
MAKKNQVGISLTADEKDFKAKMASASKAVKDLKEATEAHAKDMKSSFGGISQAVLKAGIAGQVATSIFNSLKETFKETVLGVETLTVVSEVYHAALIDLINGTRDLGTAMANAQAIANKVNILRQDERIETIKQAKAQFEYNKLVFDAADKGKTLTERIELWTAALKKHNEMIDLGVNHTKEELSVVQLRIKNTGATNTLLDEEARLTAHLWELEAERFAGTKRVQSQLTGAVQKDHEDKIKAWYDEIEAMNDVYDAQQRLLEQTKRNNKLDTLTPYRIPGGNKITQVPGISKSSIKDITESLSEQSSEVERLQGVFTDMFLSIDKGFKGMADVVINELKRIAAEIAAQLLLYMVGMIINPAGTLAVNAFTNLSKMGFPGFANGTNYAPGGMAMVGERGPELVNLPRGSQVIPNNKLSTRLYGKIKLSGKDAYILVSNYADYLNSNT